jgi:hypothetical protein
MKCTYDLAWIGKCGKEDCEKHADLKCASCKAKATHQCAETGQFVCGCDLCDDCEHTLAEDGSNGGIGFYRTSPLPEGYGEHCKKTEQRYQPWYAREVANA